MPASDIMPELDGAKIQADFVSLGALHPNTRQNRPARS
jgi:hypothetical protein